MDDRVKAAVIEAAASMAIEEMRLMRDRGEQIDTSNSPHYNTLQGIFEFHYQTMMDVVNPE